MSTLWTPSGERPVGRAEPSTRPTVPQDLPPDAVAIDEHGNPLTEDDLRARAEELRGQLAAMPVENLVAQLAYQLFEVAALHLSLDSPQLPQARLAIDALAALVEGLAGRLGEHESSLRDGLAQIRMAFVQIGGAHEAGDEDQQ